MNATVELSAIDCADCGCVFAVTAGMEGSLRVTHREFYCPNGHALTFPDKSEAEKLRDELRSAKNRLAAIEEEKRLRRERASRTREKKLRAVS